MGLGERPTTGEVGRGAVSVLQAAALLSDFICTWLAVLLSQSSQRRQLI